MRSLLLYEHQNAMYNDHVEVTKPQKRVLVNFWWPKMQGSIGIYIKSHEVFHEVELLL